MNEQRPDQDGMCKQHIIDLIKNQSPLIIVELGAADGSDAAQILQRMDADDRYFAVEADPRNIPRFVTNDSRLTLINAAITDQDKEDGTLHMCTGIIPSLGRPHFDGSSIKELCDETFDVMPWMKFEDIKLPHITLDSFMEKYNINKIDFIWCDVEGATREVIDGGLKALAKTRYFYTKTLVDEDAYSYKGMIKYTELVEKMKSIGFELMIKFKWDALFKNMNYK